MLRRVLLMLRGCMSTIQAAALDALRCWLWLCLEDVGEGAHEAGQHVGTVKGAVTCDGGRTPLVDARDRQ